jgi:hypothetical protein
LYLKKELLLKNGVVFNNFSLLGLLYRLSRGLMPYNTDLVNVDLIDSILVRAPPLNLYNVLVRYSKLSHGGAHVFELPVVQVPLEDELARLEIKHLTDELLELEERVVSADVDLASKDVAIGVIDRVVHSKG